MQLWEVTDSEGETRFVATNDGQEMVSRWRGPSGFLGAQYLGELEMPDDVFAEAISARVCAQMRALFDEMAREKADYENAGKAAPA